MVLKKEEIETSAVKECEKSDSHVLNVSLVYLYLTVKITSKSYRSRSYLINKIKFMMCFKSNLIFIIFSTLLRNLKIMMHLYGIPKQQTYTSYMNMRSERQNN